MAGTARPRGSALWRGPLAAASLLGLALLTTDGSAAAGEPPTTTLPATTTTVDAEVYPPGATVPPIVPDRGPLPQTGASDTQQWLRIGAVGVLAGGFIVVASSRRRHAAEEHRA